MMNWVGARSVGGESEVASLKFDDSTVRYVCLLRSFRRAQAIGPVPVELPLNYGVHHSVTGRAAERGC